MPVLETKGALSAQGYGLATSRPAASFIEDVFSTWLYTGNGSTQTITNGIDLAGKGGLVWIKGRNVASSQHLLFDTNRGPFKPILSNASLSEQNYAPDSLTAFTATGFSLTGTSDWWNQNASTYASWTFREQPRFFDIVTYTGNGAASRSIAHSLGSAPGCVMVKRTDATGNWKVAFTIDGALLVGPLCLNSAEGESGTLSIQGGYINNANATTFTLVSNAGSVAEVNASGGTYVAYIFANDAGGFGATGADNVISCWYYEGNGSTAGPVVTLGYEPQWLLIKRVLGGTGDWNLIDNMRGFVVGGTDAELNPNLTNAETTGTFVTPTATGFQLNTTDAGYNGNGSLYVYIAIRRGPMRTPTSGTQVFGLNARTGTGANATVTGGQTDDAVMIKNRGAAVIALLSSRLTGTGRLLTANATAEVAVDTTVLQTNPWDVMDGVKVGTTSSSTNASGNTFINYLFRRAPSFFDVVCYTGNGVNRTIAHNLGSVPELMIVKGRSDATAWQVYSSALANTEYLVFNTTAAKTTGVTRWNSTTPTASVFSIGNGIEVNTSAATYIAYLFASAPGVSKVGSYTGTGATQIINCGFAAGARFVLIKRTDDIGDWYVWDSARGIVAGNDPYWRINNAAAEVTNTDWVDTAASGFELSNAGGNLVNVNGGSYIFLSVS